MVDKCDEKHEAGDVIVRCIRAPGHNGPHYDGLLVRWENELIA